MLNVLDHFPDTLLRLDASRLHEVLAGPTLIHLEGKREPALFVSLLLHGDEDTGWRAAQALLQKYHGQALPRALSLFVGNVAAARHGVRRLDGQPDHNRIWPGGEAPDSPEAGLMREVVERMRARGVFASIDVHNNTGLNPHYACVNRIDHRALRLATLFSRTVVYFIRPAGVQAAAFAPFCPAVTLECGKPGNVFGVQHAFEYLDACLHLAEIADEPVAGQDLNLFHTVAVVKVPARFSFGFGEGKYDLCFPDDLDHLNFRELPAGAVLARIRPRSGACLEAWDEAGHDAAAAFFRIVNDEIRLAQPVMPSMLTLNARAIRQDCLCYFMARMTL